MRIVVLKFVKRFTDDWKQNEKKQSCNENYYSTFQL